MNFSKKINNLDLTYIIWLLILTFMSFCMIIIGGLTRLTDSGLSMVDWRPILGIIPPINKESWIEVFNTYKATPEYKIVNYSMNLNEFKNIFWWEWFHRFFARCIGIVFIFPFLYFLLKKYLNKKKLLALFFIFCLGIFQATVGWWMVKSGQIDDPFVSAYRLTFHLTNALIIFSILFWISLSSIYLRKARSTIKDRNSKFFIFIIFLLFITIISGGFMAGTGAGQSFNTFPLMNGEIFPNDYFLNENKLLNLFENTVAINFNHRWLASLTFIFTLSFIIYLLFFTIKKHHTLSLYIVIFFISIQFFLGILTLLNNVPISLASMHQTNSVLLLASVFFAYHKYKYRKESL